MCSADSSGRKVYTGNIDPFAIREYLINIVDMGKEY